MTFGEHLEELRRALAKAMIWLGIGLAVGLFFADRLVQFVQEPLQRALTEFYVDKTLHELGADPGDPTIAQDRALLQQLGLHREIVYVMPEAMAGSAGEPEVAATPVPAGEAEPIGASDAVEAVSPDVPGDAAPEVAPVGDAAPEDTAAAEPPPAAEGPSMADALVVTGERLGLSKLVPLDIYRPVDAGLNTLKVEEPFMIWLKAGLVIGAVLASPAIFYHLWQFVAAGLYRNERQYVYIYMPFSMLLFWAGVAMAFFFVLRFVLQFLLQFNAHLHVEAMPRLTDYISFVLILPLGFGIAFQLPLVMLFLQRIGLFETEAYIRSWRIAILVIFLIAMILTPADIYSMIGLAVPLTLLYFLGILMCQFMPRGRGIGSEGYDPA